MSPADDAEHDREMTDPGWSAVQTLTAAYNARDDFTAFRAHELTTPNGTNAFFEAAHQIVIYRDDFG